MADLDVQVVATEEWHIDVVADNARQADIDELWAASRSTPRESITRGVASSSESWTVLIDGEPVAIAGVAPISVLTGIGCPWMIATHGIERKPRAFLTASRHYVAEMLRYYQHLVNYVDMRNAVAIRYLGWLGFEFGEEEAIGPFSMPFRKFEMRA